MALKFYDSPFHVTHDNETASKMATEVDLSIMQHQPKRQEERVMSKFFVNAGFTLAVCGGLLAALGAVVFVGLMFLHGLFGVV